MISGEYKRPLFHPEGTLSAGCAVGLHGSDEVSNCTLFRSIPVPPYSDG